MNLLDALACPYCSAPLLKESYYFRCERDHRFELSFRSSSPASGPSPDEGGDAAQEAEAGAAPSAAQGSAAAPSPELGGQEQLLLRVIAHPDRGELGRVHAYGLEAD